MIELNFCKKNINERKKIVAEFREYNLKKRRAGTIDKIEEWCVKYLKNVNGISYDFSAVIEALPEELLAIKQFLDENYDVVDIMNKLPKNGKNPYIVSTLFNRMNSTAKEKLLNSLNVEVCPYCNRNYIFTGKNFSIGQLDHFIPKGKYPLFASSFYNLIPSCPYCNNKKSDNEFYFYPHMPAKSTDEIMTFSYKMLGINHIKDLTQIEVELNIHDKNYKQQAEKLNLDSIYKHHKSSVQDILKKREIFSDAYMTSLLAEFPNVFDSYMDVEEVLYGISLTETDYGRRPLSKLTKDIIIEVSKSKK